MPSLNLRARRHLCLYVPFESHHRGLSVFPQWLLVNELSRFGSLESLRAETVARSGRPVADIMPHLIGKAKGANGHTVVTLVLPGDETHPTAPGLAGQKCRLQWSPTATGADRMHYEVTVGPSR